MSLLRRNPRADQSGGVVNEPEDDLIKRLQQTLHELTRGESGLLFEEARSEARAEAKRILKELLIRGHLENARAWILEGDRDEDRFERAPAERDAKATSVPTREPRSEAISHGHGDGTYVYAYGVVDVSEQLDLTEIPSITGRHDLEVSSRGGVAAIVSRVDAAEFSSAALKRNLEDFDWLERRARAHESVLSSVLDQADVLPFPFLTIFRDDSSVHRLLSEKQQHLAETLKELASKVEMGLKLYVSPTRHREWMRTSGDRIVPLRPAVGHTGPGHSYLAGRKAEERLTTIADEQIEDFARSVHQAFREAVESKILRPQNNQLSGRSDPMVLNAGYLVEREKTEAFEDLAAKLKNEMSERGFDLEVTGPWPAHNFVPEEKVLG
jgi:plasmid stabilization system protein ParE